MENTSKISINETSTSGIEYWIPTLNLRWFEHGLGKNVHPSYSNVKIKRLQQMFQGSLGSVEWRDIPTENE